MRRLIVSAKLRTEIRDVLEQHANKPPIQRYNHTLGWVTDHLAREFLGSDGEKLKRAQRAEAIGLKIEIATKEFNAMHESIPPRKGVVGMIRAGTLLPLLEFYNDNIRHVENPPANWIETKKLELFHAISDVKRMPPEEFVKVPESTLKVLRAIHYNELKEVFGNRLEDYQAQVETTLKVIRRKLSLE